MKFLLAIALMFCPTSVTYPVDTILSVTTNYAYMYKSPDFNAGKYDFTLDHNDEVYVVDGNLNNDFYLVSYTYNNVSYDGYVYKECLAVLEDEQEVMLVYNAKTAIKTNVYFLNDQGQIDTDGISTITLEENTELYLYEGYNRKAEFNAVKFSYEGKIMLGYIRTEDISPYGVSNVLIISITAIIACVSVIMILLGISKKKSKVTILLKKFGKKEKQEKQ